MADPIPEGVLSTREARRHLSDFLREAREQGREAPVHFYGAHRQAEAAIMPAELAHELLDLLDEVVIAAQIQDRADDEVIHGTVDELLERAGIDRQRVHQRRARRAERRGA